MNNNLSSIKSESNYDRSARLGASFPRFVTNLAIALDAALPADTSDYEYSGTITLRDGTKLSLCLNGYAGKVEVSVSNLRDSRGQIYTARDTMNYAERKGLTPVTRSVNVAAEGRSFEVLAKDITRRLLPDARKFWIRICGAVKHSNDYVSGCAAQAEKFAELLGCEPSPCDSTKAEKNLYVSDLQGVHRVTVRQGNVDFNFSGSPKIAKKLLALLKELSVK